MSTPALQTEDILWAVKYVLRAQLPASLLEVQTRRNAELDPLTLEPRCSVTLPLPVRIDLGFDENVLYLPITAFPRVNVIGAPLSPNNPLRGDQRIAEATHDVLLEWLTFNALRSGVPAEEIKTEAVCMAVRYGEAIIAVLRQGGSYAGFEPPSIIPAVDEGQPMIWKDRETGAELGYLTGGTITLPVTGRYTA